MSEVIMATATDRLWHWVHATCIVLLGLTGFNIHFAQSFPLFESMGTAVALHNLVGWIALGDFGLWLAYNLASRRARFYIPNREDLPGGLIEQGLYYTIGIFRHAPHPFETDGVTRKFNPLQKMTYLGIMTTLVPAQAATGVLLYRYTQNWAALNEPFVRAVSLLHTALAYFFIAFVIGHIYLATTGATPWSHFQMMITGREPRHSEK